MLRIDNNKPIELMSKDNEWSIKNRVDKLHCMTSNLSVVRKLWNKRVHHATKELRRGYIKCVLETHLANQDLYIRVMNGLL
jgi:hypothetical protein